MESKLPQHPALNHPKDPRTFALEWVRRTLSEELGHGGPLVGQRAELLIDVAEKHGMRIEDLIAWIRIRVPGKTWSKEELRRYCAYVAKCGDFMDDAG